MPCPSGFYCWVNPDHKLIKAKKTNKVAWSNNTNQSILSAANKRVKELKPELKALKSAIETLERELKEIKEEITSIDNKLRKEKDKSVKDRLRREWHEADNKRKELHKVLNVKENKHSKTQVQLNSEKQKASTASAYLERFRKIDEQLDRQLRDLNAKCER